MASYTVYVPYSIGGASRRADKTIFIREGFSVPAFVFGPLYLLYRRLWWATLGWGLAAALIFGLARVLGLDWPRLALLLVMLQWLTGFEATVLWQFGLVRRGYYFAALLACPTLEQAERGFFNGEGLRDQPMRTPDAQEPGEPSIGSPEVIGLFPHTGGA